MRIYTKERTPGTVPLGALFMAPLFALPLGAWIVEQQFVDPGECGAKQALDIPCLTCGSTRATLQLLDGNILAAVSLQPMMMSIYVLLGVWGLASLGTFLRDRHLVVKLNTLERRLFIAALIVLPFLNWAYLIWAGV